MNIFENEFFFNSQSFFSYEKVESGVALFKKAITMNHMGAMYVYKIILLCKDSNSNENEGLYLLDVIKKSNQLEECRVRVKYFILTIWVRNHSLKYEELKIYYVETCCKKKEVGVDKDQSDTYFGEVECEKTLPNLYGHQ